MNRNGDVPITILVLGVFAVCSLALFSFYLSGSDASKISARVGIVEKINSLSDEIKFYKKFETGQSPEEAMQIFKKQDMEENLIYSGKFDSGFYELNATQFENQIEFFGFGFGERKPVFSVLYRFNP